MSIEAQIDRAQKVIENVKKSARQMTFMTKMMRTLMDDLLDLG